MRLTARPRAVLQTPTAASSPAGPSPRPRASRWRSSTSPARDDRRRAQALHHRAEPCPARHAHVGEAGRQVGRQHRHVESRVARDVEVLADRGAGLEEQRDPDRGRHGGGVGHEQERRGSGPERPRATAGWAVEPSTGAHTERSRDDLPQTQKGRSLSAAPFVSYLLVAGSYSATSSRSRPKPSSASTRYSISRSRSSSSGDGGGGGGSSAGMRTWR